MLTIENNSGEEDMSAMVKIEFKFVLSDYNGFANFESIGPILRILRDKCMKGYYGSLQWWNLDEINLKVASHVYFDKLIALKYLKWQYNP